MHTYSVICIIIKMSQVEEFNRCVSTTGMMLLPHGVLIVWEWEWMAADDQHSTNSSDIGFDTEQQANKYL